MRLPEDPGDPVPPPAQPTRDLLLAQALDACITAERRLPGSSQEIIARQPDWARADLRRLVDLAGSLDAATSNALMSSEFRVAARARLMQRIGGETRHARTGGAPPSGSGHAQDGPARESRPAGSLGVVQLNALSPSDGVFVAPRHTLTWVTRATAGLLAAALAVTATLTASASALPGEPLYPLKQVKEELGLRLAADDQQRSLALLRQADARLDETTRLLQLGRTIDATSTTLLYDQEVQLATLSYVGTHDNVPASVHIEASLSQDQDQLQALLRSAPEPARADLRVALAATERSRALVADPRPDARSLDRSDPSTDAVLAAAVPTLPAEEPTLVPSVAAQNPTAVPILRPALVGPAATVVAVVADALGDDGARTTPVVAQVVSVDGEKLAVPDEQRATVSTSDSGRGNSSSPTPQPVRNTTTQDQRSRGSTPAQVAPTVVARDEPIDTPDSGVEGGDGHAQADSSSGRLASTQSGTQADRSGRGDTDATPQTGVATRQPVDVVASNGADGHSSGGGASGRSTGGDDGGSTARTATAQPVAEPQRASGGENASTGTDRNGRDNGGDGRAPTSQVAATKPQATAPPATSASGTSGSTTSSAAPTASAGRHGGDGDPPRADNTQKSTPAPATQKTGDAQKSGDNQKTGDTQKSGDH